MEKEFESQGVNVWFEELNVVEGSVTNFVYGFEDEGQKSYVRCELKEVLEDEDSYGVFLVDEENKGFIGIVGERK